MGRLKALINEYGPYALGTYLTIWLGVWAGFAVAIHVGAGVESTAGIAGTIGAAWVATKATQPIRIAATLALTPLVAAAGRRLRPRPRESTAAPEEGSEP